MRVWQTTGLAVVTAALVSVGPTLADSFSFGDYFFPGDMLASGFSSFTDGNDVYHAYAPGSGFTVYTEGHGWMGEFVYDTTLLYDDGTPGPVTITFQSPVSSITGLSAEPDLYGPYAATMKVYAGSTLLGSSSYSSFNGPGLEGTIPAFRFSHRGITSIVIDTTNDALGFAIGGGPGIPEPRVWALMLVGFGGLGLLSRSRRRTARQRIA